MLTNKFRRQAAEFVGFVNLQFSLSQPPLRSRPSEGPLCGYPPAGGTPPSGWALPTRCSASCGGPVPLECSGRQTRPSANPRYRFGFCAAFAAAARRPLTRPTLGVNRPFSPRMRPSLPPRGGCPPTSGTPPSGWARIPGRRGLPPCTDRWRRGSGCGTGSP